MSLKSTISTAAAVLLAAASLAAGPPTTRCVGLDVTAADDGARPRWGGFSVTAVTDLTLTTTFLTGVAGEHLLTLDLITPDGQLYASLVQPFTGPTGPLSMVQVRGYPRPIRSRRARLTFGGRTPLLAVDVRFPVAGTDIVATGLYGAWRVEARVDGAEKPCKSATFTLSP